MINRKCNQSCIIVVDMLIIVKVLMVCHRIKKREYWQYPLFLVFMKQTIKKLLKILLKLC